MRCWSTHPCFPCRPLAFLLITPLALPPRPSHPHPQVWPLSVKRTDSAHNPQTLLVPDPLPTVGISSPSYTVQYLILSLLGVLHPCISDLTVIELKIGWNASSSETSSHRFRPRERLSLIATTKFPQLSSPSLRDDGILSISRNRGSAGLVLPHLKHLSTCNISQPMSRPGHRQLTINGSTLALPTARNLTGSHAPCTKHIELRFDAHVTLFDGNDDDRRFLTLDYRQTRQLGTLSPATS
ncbi:hypothetical protein LZ30DRAFT_440500 [Colletotrichum cereale]|nr:hypothetical protein LZ30DRAFT_440500 [Colletotrichum cereale]